MIPKKLTDEYNNAFGKLMTINEELSALDRKLLTVEEYLIAEQKIREKYIQMAKDASDKEMQEFMKNVADKLAKTQAIIQTTQNAVKNMQAIETAENEVWRNNELAKEQAKLDAVLTSNVATEEQIAAAKQDYANRKNEIEYQQKVKDLETQKKYADAQFAISIGSIVVSAAAAILKTWEGYAAMGPFGVGLATAQTIAIGAEAVTQGILAKAERDKIKSLTIEAPSADSVGESAKPSPKRVALPDKMQPKFAEGGYTGDGGKYEPAGIVHKGEYVVPQWMLQQPPAINYVRALEAIRQTNKTLERIETNHIKAYVVLTELEAKQKELNSVKTSK